MVAGWKAALIAAFYCTLTLWEVAFSGKEAEIIAFFDTQVILSKAKESFILLGLASFISDWLHEQFTHFIFGAVFTYLLSYIILNFIFDYSIDSSGFWTIFWLLCAIMTLGVIRNIRTSTYEANLERSIKTKFNVTE